MDIQIQQLTKSYGFQKAVDNISFSVKTGEVLGFLGPNGAGKTTTMKMITNYIDIEGGDILINGTSVKGGQMKKHIGYLPEHNPLTLSLEGDNIPAPIIVKVFKDDTRSEPYVIQSSQNLDGYFSSEQEGIFKNLIPVFE